MDKKILFIGIFILVVAITISFLIIFKCSLYTKEDISSKRYDAVLKEVTIMDRQNEAAKMKLDTRLDNHVSAGYNMVAQFTINPKQDISNFIKGFKLINLKDGKIINRNIDIKYKTIQPTSINDYKHECSNLKYPNGTSYIHCENIKLGSHLENREVWLPFNNNLKLNENITIGLFTNVQAGDHIEWIPTYTINGIDIKVSEWAIWTADLNINLVAYYNFNDGSGTNLDEKVGHLLNGTTINTPTWEGGILGGGMHFTTGSSQYVNFSATDEFAITGEENFSISVWIYPNSTAGYHAIAGKQDNWHLQENGLKLTFKILDADGGYHNYYETTNNVLTAGVWQHVVLTYNGTGNFVGSSAFFAVNGVPVDTLQNFDAGDNLNNPGNFKIGVYPAMQIVTRYFDGGIDELGIWNRTLTLGEIEQLYNGGIGITYALDSITLNYPKATDIQNNLSVPFNCSVSFSSSTITNVSLIINGFYNETNISGINNADYIFSKNFASSGLRNWTCEACGMSSCINGTTSDFYIKLNISGTIKDSNSNPIYGATIIVLNQSDTRWAGNATSDANGNWTIGPVLAGNYSIVGYNITNSSLNGAIKSHVIVP